MRFIGLKSCDTCRKARNALTAAGRTLDVIDVRADGISSDDLDAILAAHGGAAINRASTTWRGLSDAEKAGDTRDLLLAHPTLLKRPAIKGAEGWTLGWKPDVAAQHLGS